MVKYTYYYEFVTLLAIFHYLCSIIFPSSNDLNDFVLSFNCLLPRDNPIVLLWTKLLQH